MRIKNVRIIDWNHDFVGEIEVRGGKIAAFGTALGDVPAGEEIIDGRGKILMPSFIDLHAHFRDPGLTHKEDMESGSRAAVKGGYTFVNLMGNTKPVCSTMDTIRAVEAKAEAVGLVEVNQVASITENFDGETLSHLDALEGVKWISDDGTGVMDSGTMLAALEKAKELDMGLMCHEEELPLVPLDTYLAEDLMTLRDTQMALRTGTRLHVCHVSTEGAMDAVIRAKKAGAPVTCEVCPHHLYLNDETDYRVNPPLRTEHHRKAMVRAVVDGWVDAISTDHAPHTAEDKAGGANGISGIEHAFSVINTALAETGELPLTGVSKLMSKNPGDIMGIPKGRLEVGYDADFVLVDPEVEITIKAEEMASRGKNTPLNGKTLRGEILLTIRKGAIVYDKCNG